MMLEIKGLIKQCRFGVKTQLHCKIKGRIPNCVYLTRPGPHGMQALLPYGLVVFKYVSATK